MILYDCWRCRRDLCGRGEEREAKSWEMGAWSLELGAWSLELGAWSGEQGLLITDY